MPNINWDFEKDKIDKQYRQKGAPPIQAGNDYEFDILVTLHERVYYTWESGHLQCSRPMINCSIEHLGDHQRKLKITKDVIEKAATEIDNKLSESIQATVKTSLPGIGDVSLKGDLSNVTGIKDQVSEELKKHMGEEPVYTLYTHAPPCYEIIVPFGAYSVLAIDGDAKIKRWFKWDATKAEIEWTSRIEVEPNPPFGFKASWSTAFGMFQWEESDARKVRPCECRGLDLSEQPPTMKEAQEEDSGFTIEKREEGKEEEDDNGEDKQPEGKKKNKAKPPKK